MNKILKGSVIVVIVLISFCQALKAQTSARMLRGPANDVPWTDSQLMEPSKLAAMLKDGSSGIPVIFNIGAVEDIKAAKHIGPVSKAENLDKLKAEVKTLPKNTPVVLYCGCCPFSKCPNIRPALSELQHLGYTHIMVLDLPVNLKTNWIAKNYPLASSK